MPLVTFEKNDVLVRTIISIGSQMKGDFLVAKQDISSGLTGTFHHRHL